jgi:TolB-like protein
MRLICSLIAIWCFFMGCANLGGDNGPSSRREIRDENHFALKEDDSPRKRLMVLPFLDVSQSQGSRIPNEARADFIRELNQRGRLIAIDSSEIKIDPDKSLRKGEYDLPEIAKQANALGVHAVLEGKIMNLDVRRQADPVGVFRQVKTRFEAQVRVRVFSARSAHELFNTVKTVTEEDSGVRMAEKTGSDQFISNNPQIIEKLVKDAFADFTPQIELAMNKMSWEGRIAMVNGDRIFLNVGKISGLQLGDILKVSEEGDEIYDPQSGNYIGKTPGRMKGTLEVVSYFGQDGAITIIHSGSGFKESDRVELY